VHRVLPTHKFAAGRRSGLCFDFLWGCNSDAVAFKMQKFARNDRARQLPANE